jgi:large subunit ribosomal protein L21
MYAIVADGGRQYRVETGQVLDIDFREGLESGESFRFEKVLAIGGNEGLRLGKPTIEGAAVEAEVVGLEKGDKIYIEKYRRRKNYHRRTGHRQLYTRVKIAAITG